MPELKTTLQIQVAVVRVHTDSLAGIRETYSLTPLLNSFLSTADK